jgi:hypothetical protein
LPAFFGIDAASSWHQVACAVSAIISGLYPAKADPPPLFFLKLRILKDFKSHVLKLRIPKGLRVYFLEVRILKSLGTRVATKAKTPAWMLALPGTD